MFLPFQNIQYRKTIWCFFFPYREGNTRTVLHDFTHTAVCRSLSLHPLWMQTAEAESDAGRYSVDLKKVVAPEDPPAFPPACWKIQLNKCGEGNSLTP